MKKSTINLIIDAIMLVLMMAVAGIGFLMKFVLLAGFERSIKYGSNVDLLYWGMNRHQWGAIHLKISYVLLVLLVLHIVLHWKQVVGIYRRMIPNKNIRIAAAVALLLLSIMLFLFPFAIQPQIVIHQNKDSHSIGSPVQGKDSVLNTNNKVSPANVEAGEHTDDIEGYMSLREVAEKYDISPEDLARKLKVPAKKVDDRIGQLKLEYGFSMEQLRQILKQKE